MQRKVTQNLHSQIANKTMSFICANIDAPLSIDKLSLHVKVTPNHLHKVFKEQIGINIYEIIKSIRLQKASNLLLSNRYSTVADIAKICGYSSLTSFIKAFKHKFSQTPKKWRNGGHIAYSNKILENSLLGNSLPNFDESKVKIVKTKPKKIYYIRQNGYISEECKQKWKELKDWVYENNIEEHEEIGIFHDNPAITAHKDCFYTAAISPKNKLHNINTNISSNILSEGLYATFDIHSKGNEAGWFIRWAYHEWLPYSGFETTTEPSYLVMKKNHILDENGIDATFYLPICNA